jgi:hypothetical protein
MAPQVQLRSCESRPFRRFGESARHMPAIPGIGRMGADETAINQRDFDMLKYRFLADICRWGGLPVSTPKLPATGVR